MNESGGQSAVALHRAMHIERDWWGGTTVPRENLTRVRSSSLFRGRCLRTRPLLFRAANRIAKRWKVPPEGLVRKFRSQTLIFSCDASNLVVCRIVPHASVDVSCITKMLIVSVGRGRARRRRSVMPTGSSSSPLELDKRRMSHDFSRILRAASVRDR